MNLQAYNRRLGAKTSSKALENQSIKQVKRLFKNSPTYKEIILNNTTVGVRVNLVQKSSERLILFKPDEGTSVGSIAEFDSKKWMVQEFLPSRVYPKAKVQFCNETIKWIDELGNTIEHPCVATGSNYSLQEGDKYVIHAEGKLTVLVSHNSDTSKIQESQRFIFGGKSYEVVGIDNVTRVDNGVGILQILVELTSSSESDNEISKVADNKDNNTGWGGGW